VFPKRFSVKMGEQNRIGKIYIDYLRNQKMASTVAAYSARARAGLGVSVPLAWDELDAISGAAAWNIRTLAERLKTQKQDPWQDYWRTRQIISKPMRRALGLPEGGAS
jgi:bifunctional non-homologous end joining protein LigD